MFCLMSNWVSHCFYNSSSVGQGLISLSFHEFINWNLVNVFFASIFILMIKPGHNFSYVSAASCHDVCKVVTLSDHCLRDWSWLERNYSNNTLVIWCPAQGRPTSAAWGTSLPDSKSQECCWRNSLPTHVINKRSQGISSLHSLWLSDAIWWQRSGSTLAQVMAWCLTAPSHYLNQCWLIISEVQWHSY